MDKHRDFIQIDDQIEKLKKITLVEKEYFLYFAISELTNLVKKYREDNENLWELLKKEQEK